MNELLSYESYVTEMAENGSDVVGYGICEKENSFEIYLNANTGVSSLATINSIEENSELPISISYQAPVISCATLWGEMQFQMKIQVLQ